jgi:ABC-2 type transport system permease protein
MPRGVVPAWFLLLQVLSPTGAYNALVQRLLLGGGTAVEARIGGLASIYINPGPFLFILLAWAAVPLIIGYLGFRRADLRRPKPT